MSLKKPHLRKTGKAVRRRKPSADRFILPPALASRSSGTPRRTTRASLLAEIETLKHRLQLSEALLQQAEIHAGLGTWEYNVPSDTIVYSGNLAAMLGLPARADPAAFAEVGGMLTDGKPEEIRDGLLRIADSGEPEVRYSTRVLPNRQSRVRRTLYHPVVNGNRRVNLILGVTQDVTDVTVAEESMRRLSHRLITVQNDERRRMARNLHETASQTLAAVKLTLGKVARALPSQPRTAADGIASARVLVEDALREVRSVSALLHPPLLEEAGLSAALYDYTRTLSERSGLAIHVSIPTPLDRMAREIELTLFRVVQESLTNIHRHAKAQSCWICVSQAEGTVTLKVRDDGVGMPGSKGEVSSAAIGIGISGMRERAKQLKGQFGIDSAPGHGTTVQVQLPIGSREP
jgi:signal transduction histidine kinase